MAYQQGRLFIVPVERCLYYLLLRPDDRMYRKMQELKLMADSFLGNKDSSNRLPHMTLMQFLMHGKDENSLIAEIRRVVDDMDALTLMTDTITCFKESNTIYMGIDNEEDVHNLKDHLLYRFYRSGLISKKDLKINTDIPHMTIAKSVEDLRVNALQKNLQSMSFTPTGFGASLVLLKREISVRKWERVATFHLPE